MKKIPLINLFKGDENGLIVRYIDEATISDHLSQSGIVEPHRHDAFFCMLIEAGNMDILIDFTKIRINGYQLLISAPGQVHEFVGADSIKGWYISFESHFITEDARDALERSLEDMILLNLEESEFQWFGALISLLTASLSPANTMAVSPQAVHTLLVAVLLQAMSLVRFAEQRASCHQSLNKVNITRNFRQLVRKNFRILKSPSGYARMMNLSVSYLNDTVKSVSGLSLSHIIQRQVIVEAERLLCYSNFSVKEIGIMLGYEDYQYFNRLFSKVAGVSPGEFRKKNRFGSIAFATNS